MNRRQKNHKNKVDHLYLIQMKKYVLHRLIVPVQKVQIVHKAKQCDILIYIFDIQFI